MEKTDDIKKNLERCSTFDLKAMVARLESNGTPESEILIHYIKEELSDRSAGRSCP